MRRQHAKLKRTNIQREKQKDAKDSNLINKYENTPKMKSMRPQIP